MYVYVRKIKITKVFNTQGNWISVIKNIICTMNCSATLLPMQLQGLITNTQLVINNDISL